MSEANTSTVERPALRYFGSKWRLARWILAHCPPHECWVDVYGGGAGLTLRKEPSASEVFNDLDREVVNFFRVLRAHTPELLWQLANTPFSRVELAEAYGPVAGLGEVERARRFMVKSWQGRGGPRAGHLTGWKWQSRTWPRRATICQEWDRAKDLEAVAKRLLNVQLECDDALTVIRRFDTPATLFYCDPPYPAETRNKRWIQRGYAHEVEPDHHVHLANLLQRIKGMAIVSSYPNDQYDELYAGWGKVTTTTQTMHKTIATEVLWLSPRVVAALGAAGNEKGKRKSAK